MWEGGEKRLHDRCSQAGAGPRGAGSSHRLLLPSILSPTLLSLSRCWLKRASRARSPSNLKILPSRQTGEWLLCSLLPPLTSSSARLLTSPPHHLAASPRRITSPPLAASRRLSQRRSSGQVLPRAAGEQSWPLRRLSCVSPLASCVSPRASRLSGFAHQGRGQRGDVASCPR